MVELNLKNEGSGARQVTISSKTKTSKNLKTLSNKEIKDLKKKIKKTKKIKNEKQIVQNKEYDRKKDSTNIKIKQNNVNKKKREIVDVCTLLQKCSIEEISKYLIKQGRKKDFPDLTIRQ